MKRSSILSIIFHLIVFGLLFFYATMQKPFVLTQSDSMAMDVAFIDPSMQTITQPVAPVEPVKETIDVAQNEQADIKLKDDEKTPPKIEKAQPIEKPKVENKPIAKVEQKQDTKATEIKNKVNKSAAKNKSHNVNDLLDSDLLGDDSAHGKSTIGKSGTGTGSGGSGNTAGYADAVVKKVRPFIEIPDGVSPGIKVIYRVTLYSNLNIQNIKLIKSSGNKQYDQNILDALNKVATFPDLPAGARYVDYRVLNLTFTP